MGMATIKENLGAGLYRCTYRHDTARLKEELAQLAVLLTELNTAITAKNAEITNQESVITAARNALDNAIASDDIPTIRAAVNALARARIILTALQSDLEQLEAQRADARARQQRLNNIQTEFQRDLWCADLSEDLQTDDARPAPTAEVPGEQVEVLLLPANNREITPLYRIEEHGQQMPLDVMSGPERYYNGAMLAGWQKYAPGYRFGRIDKINTDGTVALTLIGPDRSSQQNLPIIPASPHDDEEPTYQNVPVQYLDCDVRAFRVDDEVLIEYQENDALQPRVVGFRDHPRGCAFIKILIPNGALTLTGEEWQFEAIENPQYAQTNWFSQATQRAVSWVGPSGRFVGFPDVPELSTALYINGEKVADAPEPVIGACIRLENTIPFLVVVTYTQNPGVSITERCWKKELEADGSWQELGFQTWADDIFISSPETFPNTSVNNAERVGHYFFNESGTEATAVKQCTWRDPDQVLIELIPWLRTNTLTVGQNAAQFVWSATEDASPITGNNWTVVKEVAVDYIGDQKVAAQVEIVQTGTGVPLFTTLARQLKTDTGFDEFLTYGEQGTGAEAGDGEITRYFDLRTDPPIWAYLQLRNTGGFTGTYRLALKGLFGFQLLGPSISQAAPGFGNPFSIGGRFNFPFEETNALVQPSGTFGLNDQNGFLLTDQKFSFNFITPQADLPTLTGIAGFIDPVGVG